MHDSHFSRRAVSWTFATATAMFAAVGHADSLGNRMPWARAETSRTSVFAVNITNNLFEPPVRTEVAGGELSVLLRLSGSHDYRVRVSPLSTGYALQLTDGDGNELDSAVVRDDATATFRRFGVQVHVLALGRSGGTSGS